MAIGRDVMAQVAHLLRPLQTRIANSIARAVVQLVDDATRLQLLQLGVLAGEDVDDAERFQSYGFSSVPLAGAEAVVLFPGGDRAHPLVVAVDDRRHRPTGGKPGEVIVYNHTGAKVRLLDSGDIEVVPGPGGEVRIGAASASDPPALSSELADLKDRIDRWIPVPNDGGSSLKAVFEAWTVPGATKVRAE
jgi:phage gp45-like